MRRGDDNRFKRLGLGQGKLEAQSHTIISEWIRTRKERGFTEDSASTTTGFPTLLLRKNIFGHMTSTQQNRKVQSQLPMPRGILHHPFRVLIFSFITLYSCTMVVPAGTSSTVDKSPLQRYQQASNSKLLVLLRHKTPRESRFIDIGCHDLDTFR